MKAFDTADGLWQWNGQRPTYVVAHTGLYLQAVECDCRCGIRDKQSRCYNDNVCDVLFHILSSMVIFHTTLVPHL